MIPAGTILKAPWGTYVFRGLVMPDGKLSLQDDESPSRFVVVAEARIGTGDGFDYQIRWQRQAGIGGDGHGLAGIGTARTNIFSVASHGNAALGDDRNGIESQGKATSISGADAPGLDRQRMEWKGQDQRGDERQGTNDSSLGSVGNGMDAPGVDRLGVAREGSDEHGCERQGLPSHDPSRPEQCAWMKEVLKQTIKCGTWECPPSCPNNERPTLLGVLWRVPPPMAPDERKRVDAAFAHLRALRARPRPEATSTPQPSPITWRAKHVGKPPWSHDPAGPIWDRPGLGEKRKAQLIEWYEERAGIMEHMGKLSTGEAEYRAYGLLVDNCRRHGVTQ